MFPIIYLRKYEFVSKLYSSSSRLLATEALKPIAPVISTTSEVFPLKKSELLTPPDALSECSDQTYNQNFFYQRKDPLSIYHGDHDTSHHDEDENDYYDYFVIGDVSV